MSTVFPKLFSARLKTRRRAVPKTQDPVEHLDSVGMDDRLHLDRQTNARIPDATT